MYNYGIQGFSQKSLQVMSVYTTFIAFHSVFCDSCILRPYDSYRHTHLHNKYEDISVTDSMYLVWRSSYYTF